jgi:hypothetical protein
MRQIGKLSYLDEDMDTGYIRIISKEKYDDKINFKPSNYEFYLEQKDLIHITFDKGGNYNLRNFDLKKDHELFDIEFFKDKGVKFQLTSDRYFSRKILDNELYHYPTIFENLKGLKDKIDRVDHLSAPVKLLNSIDINELVKEYKISYREGGRDKPGDWSRAWITIDTDRPYGLDNYLKKLLPEFKFNLGKGEDDHDCLFKSDILNRLRKTIGENKIENIKHFCSELTNNIQNLAILIYSESEHAQSIRNEYHEEYSRILNLYCL